MTYVKVDIDIDDILDEADTDDLIYELETRGYGTLKLYSLKDKLKFEALAKKFESIPENELDTFLSKY